jgi:hypothetical protein
MDIKWNRCTSDCARVENCKRVKVHDNVFFAYTGTHNNGAYLGGANGLQIGDQGHSHGGGSPKPDHTEDIEVYNNIFSDPGLRAIWLDAAGLAASTNVYIHDNQYIDVPGLEIDGISFENSPSLEMSERIFSSIFDILSQGFNFQYLNIQVPINASVSVTEYNNTYNPHSLVYVDGKDLTSVKYSYNGSSTTHYFSINGENTDLWTGDLQHKGSAVYLQGSFDAEKLQVTCYNSQGYSRITDFNITEINDNSNQIFNPQLWAFVGTLTILGFSIYRNLRRVITKW